MGRLPALGGGTLVTGAKMPSESPALIALLIVIASVAGQEPPPPPPPAAAAPLPPAAAAPPLPPQASPLLPSSPVVDPPIIPAAAPPAPPQAAAAPAADAPAAPVPDSPDLPAAARVAADKEEEDELSKLLAQEVDAKPEKAAAEPELESSRVKEAALDDKLGVELRSIVEQIQDMQREVADTLKDGGEV